MSIVVKKMNPEWKAKWVAALTGGEYKQGTGCLEQRKKKTNQASFCCLGVLCDLVVKEFPDAATLVDEPWRLEDLKISYDGTTAGIPVSIAVIVGLDSGIPMVNVDREVCDFGAAQLSYLNDTAGWDFKHIAEVIEEQL